jgi:GNAT superfamily N-acetyltransferase
MIEFNREAIPYDSRPQWEKVEKAAASGRYLFWTVGGQPVSVAGIVRSLRTVAAIGAVFTPPEKRGRGYAGSATAALSERIFAEGKSAACLYTDLSNIYSNRESRLQAILRCLAVSQGGASFGGRINLWFHPLRLFRHVDIALCASYCAVAIEQGLKSRIGRQPSAGRRQVQPVRPP